MQDSAPHQLKRQDAARRTSRAVERAAGAAPDKREGHGARTENADRTWPDPEPLNQQLLVAFGHSNRAMQARTRSLGLMPGQPKVLEHLVACDGCTQRDIARACVMDKSTVTSVLSRMEDAGLITRRPRPGDRRAAAVFLTEKGHAVAQDVLDCRAEANAIGWNGLTPADRAALSALLARVIENFSTAEDSNGT